MPNMINRIVWNRYCDNRLRRCPWKLSSSLPHNEVSIQEQGGLRQDFAKQINSILSCSAISIGTDGHGVVILSLLDGSDHHVVAQLVTDSHLHPVPHPVTQNSLSHRRLLADKAL